MVTPHLPPEQAANALLPASLARTLSSQGVRTWFVAYPAPGGAPFPRTTYVPRRSRNVLGRTRAGAVYAGLQMVRGMRSALASADLIHLHGNGFIVEVAQWLAQRTRTPYVITLYGTDVSAFDPRRHARFARVVRNARARVFYSRGLMHQAEHLELASDPSSVVYAPVSNRFHALDQAARERVRQALGVVDEPVLLTVKRLHPVGGHDTLLDALPAIVASHPRVVLWLAGSGQLQPLLEAKADALGLRGRVRFLGRVSHDELPQYYAAADLFVLPSRIESWGTVMLEALASGARVVTTDTVGGLEVRDHFPDDVYVCPVGEVGALAELVSAALASGLRSSEAGRQRIRTAFSEESCATQYLQVYRRALG